MKKNYINNKEFHNLLKEYFSTNSRNLLNQIGKNFYLIASNYMNKPKFINYSEDRKDEMISDATFCMVKYMKGYKLDIAEPNPLAYFTQFAHNAFLQDIKRHKKRKERFISLNLTENVDYSNSTTMMSE